MNTTLRNEILAMIDDKVGPPKGTLASNTTLERDIGMTGDDAWEFLLAFSKKYSVDISAFEFRKYFVPKAIPYSLRSSGC